MQPASSKSAYMSGFRACAPFVVMAAPFGMIFGVVATEAGFSLAQVMAFTSVVIAGAAQFTAMQLMTESAPIAMVIASAVAVNLRMVMYSAALQPHLGKASLWQRVLIAYTNFDQNFAIASATYDERPEMSTQDKAWFFLGASTTLAPAWILSTLVGALIGNQIPEGFALDLAMPVMFIAIFAPGLRSLAHIVAAFVAVILAIAFGWLPYNLGLITAALPAMAAGAELERRGYGR